jgi:ABC-2 type transport system permease protein
VADLGTYRHILAAQIRGQASYRTSFALDLAANALTPVIDLVALVAVFQVTRTLGTFSAIEVLVMFGLSGVGFSLADLLVGNIEKIQTYVRQGLLDTVLVRPLPVLGQLITGDFTLRRVSRVVVSVVVLALATSWAQVQWTPARVALVLTAPIFGAAFFGAMFVATATVAFFWIDSGQFAHGFTYGGRDFTSYPMNVYSGVFQKLFAYSMGFAFVAYYPALALLGRTDPLGAPDWVVWGTPLVALVAIGLAGVAWRFGVRHYRSTGS